MTDIVIKQEEQKEQKKPDVEEVKEVLKAADEYEKLKEETEKLEAMYTRNQEVKAKLALGSTVDAGTQEKSAEEKTKEEASDVLKMFE